MSGHSKWSQIKRQKGVADIKKGNLFTKLANTIVIAAKDGGDPETNFKLRLTIEKARQANMPKENIERAIKRGSGELPGARLEEITYEAFGPEGIALLIEVVTDNKNRTTAAIRNILTKHGGRLAESNSVNWLFERKGIIYLKTSKIQDKREKLELELIDQGAEDFKEEEENLIIYTSPNKLAKVKKIIEDYQIPIEHASLEFIPKNMVKQIEVKKTDKIKKLWDDLEESDEISNFYTNYED